MYCYQIYFFSTKSLIVVSFVNQLNLHSWQGLAKYGADLSDEENDVPGDVYSSAKDSVRKQDLSKDSVAYDSELDRSSSDGDQEWFR